MPIILVFGTSGCGKKIFLDALHDRHKNIRAFELDHKGWSRPLHEPELRDSLTKQLNRIKERIKSRPGIYLVGLHATHLAEAFIFSAAPIKNLRSIGPDLCITLFDDLYAVQKRLGRRGYTYSFRDLLLWQRAELLAADLIANEVVRGQKKGKNPINFLLGVKHPKKSVVSLVTNRSTCKVYAAYSITGVQKKRKPVRAKFLQEITEYRRKLYEFNLVIFDPATLDDRIIIKKVLQDKRPRAGNIRVTKKERWPFIIGRGPSYRPVVSEESWIFPLEIPRIEALVLSVTPKTPHRPFSDIDAMITQVDLRYVSQADMVTIWRPFAYGVASAGCFREAETAVLLRKPAFAYHPKEDHDMLDLKSRPLLALWPREVPLIENKTEFWTRVQEVIGR